MTETVYGNLNSNPINISISGKTNKVYGLAFPIGKYPGRKNHFIKESDYALIRSNIRQILLTAPGDRVMLPQFGCNLRQFLFAPLDDVLFDQVKNQILTSLSLYAPYLKVLTLKIHNNEDVTLTGQSILWVKLVCQVKNNTLLAPFETVLEVR